MALKEARFLASDTTNKAPDSGEEIAWSETAYSDGDKEDGPKSAASLDRSVAEQRRRRSSFASLRSAYPESRYGMVTFISEDGTEVWKEHSSVIGPQSPAFLRAFAYQDRLDRDNEEPDPCGDMRGIVRDADGAQSYRLQGVGVEEFEAFLKAVRPRIDEELDPKWLPDILVMAHDWEFLGIRQFALKQLNSATMTSCERISLARRTSLPEWIPKPYIELVTRLAPLGIDEAIMLGNRATAAISRAREAVIHRRYQLAFEENPPAWMGISFWHRNCWKVLAPAWRNALQEGTENPSLRPVDAVIDHLEKIRDQEPVKVMCPSCRSRVKIEAWLGPEKDETLAERVLKMLLGNTMESWIDQE